MMKILNLMWVLVFLSTVNGKRVSLKILTSLKNGTYMINSKFHLRCKVENATSYVWYKNGEKIISEENLQVRHNKLKIKKFQQNQVGLYKCEGKDDNGLTGSTEAFIRMKDRSCGPQNEGVTECVRFEREFCPDVRSFAPKAENLKVRIVAFNKNSTRYPALVVSWNVPEQGVTSETLWGWQLRVIGLRNQQNRPKCIQINRKDILKSAKVEKHIVVLPRVFATYMVEVQGLPSLDKHDKTVVKERIKYPDWCIISGSDKPCCEYHNTSGPGMENSYSFVNASLRVDRKNRPTLFWTTAYPSDLNVSIAGYILKWISQPDDRCFADAVALIEPHRSNYTFPNLKESCGNYSLKIEVIFKYPERVGCQVSPSVTFLYSFPKTSKVDELPPPPPSKPNVFNSVGLGIAACVIGVLVVAIIILYRVKKRKDVQSLAESLIESPLNNEEIKVFILNPNHCDLCTDVVHTLTALFHATGYIKTKFDKLVPDQQKCEGPVRWSLKMIKENDYVIIPWLTACASSSEAELRQNMDTQMFTLLSESILGEIMVNSNSRAKFIPVYLDGSSSEIIPPDQRMLHTYKIPSNIDNLVANLIGETLRRPDGSVMQFHDENYIASKEKLKCVVDKFIRSH